MKKAQKTTNAQHAPRGRIKPAQPSSDAWAELRRNLATTLADLEEDEFLIITSKAEDYYVQFAGQGKHGMRAEAVSNAFIRPDAQLSAEACQTLVRLGWKAPTYMPAEGAEEPADGSPNFYLDVATPVPYARVAALGVRTLRQIYRVRHPGELMYTAFAKDKTSIRFPLLKIQREAGSAAPSESDTPMRG